MQNTLEPDERFFLRRGQIGVKNEEYMYDFSTIAFKCSGQCVLQVKRARTSFLVRVGFLLSVALFQDSVNILTCAHRENYSNWIIVIRHKRWTYIFTREHAQSATLTFCKKFPSSLLSFQWRWCNTHTKFSVWSPLLLPKNDWFAAAWNIPVGTYNE